ncbi:MAG: hypothetical protein GX195_11005 [Firmicutes bacterium]|nr:hypothetical protein [Bacillota bacterium]
MQPKQRLLVVALVLFALLGQGVRWLAVRSGELALRPFDSAVLAQELDVQNRHCDLVHVNTAGIAELQTLPGIGPVYAERITIARRDQPFTKPEDLLRVPGIGPKRLDALVDLICFYVPDGE